MVLASTSLAVVALFAKIAEDVVARESTQFDLVVSTAVHRVATPIMTPVIYLPVAPPLLLLIALLLLAMLVVAVEMRLLAYAYRKIGVRPRYAFAVMLPSLVGSHVNVPLYSVPATRLVPPHVESVFGRRLIASLGNLWRKGAVQTLGSFVFPSLVLLFAVIRWLLLSLLVLVGVGWGFMILVNTANILIQTLVPDSLRGRVMSLYALTFLGFMPVGALIARRGWSPRPDDPTREA